MMMMMMMMKSYEINPHERNLIQLDTKAVSHLGDLMLKQSGG
jgi:hypothetical protein